MGFGTAYENFCGSVCIRDLAIYQFMYTKIEALDAGATSRRRLHEGIAGRLARTGGVSLKS
jgi:hypothetical protein